MALEQRRLAAVVSIDVVGYSRLMGIDENGTLANLARFRAELIDPLIAEYGGRIVKSMGDGLLLEYPSVVQAVRGMLVLQERLAQRNEALPEAQCLLFRVGINLGNIIIQGEDILGDGVNIAARLEALAEPGGICVAGRVHDDIRDRLDTQFEDLGPQELKNIARPVPVWCWPPRTGGSAQAAQAPVSAVPVSEKPSIAVLPFGNLSQDAEQDFFADGISEDIITGLSRIHWFLVIARNSSFAFRGKDIDPREIARELGVRYLVEGSVRKAGNRVRLSAQLVDGNTGNNLWAARYDRDLDDIFEVQDELTQTIVGAVEPELSKAEQARAKLRKPESLDVWEIYQRGMSSLHDLNQSSLIEAEAAFKSATERDPAFAPAFTGLAEVRYYNVVLGLADDPDAARTQAYEFARQALALDRDDPGARCALDRAHMVNRNFAAAIVEFKAALETNPSSALAHYGLGAARIFSGNAGDSLPNLELAIRLSPQDANMGSFLVRAAQAHLYLGDYPAAVDWARRALSQPNFQWSRQMVLSSALAHQGLVEEAGAVLAELLERIPNFSSAYALEFSPMIADEHFQRMFDGLYIAGLPNPQGPGA